MSRVVPFTRSPLRAEVEHMLKAEELSRSARRLLVPVNPAGEVERFAAATLDRRSDRPARRGPGGAVSGSGTHRGPG